MFRLPAKILLGLMLFFAVAAPAQFWMQHAGGSTIDEGMDISIDGAGNSYVTGYFTTSAAFGSTNLSSTGVDDIFLSKLGTNGLFLWAVKAGGTGSDRALSIKTDAAGNSYITGYFNGTATFGSNSITSAGTQDVFIAKYDNSGNCAWAKSAGGSGSDIGNGITVDASGNVIVTGEFAGAASFGSTTLNSMNGSTDVFTTKLDANGNFLWAKKGSAHLTDRGLDVDCDPSGNIYITGQFSDTITFGVAHNNNMLNAIFVVKYDPAGNEQWFRKAGGGAMNIANSIACDPGGQIYLTGDFQGTLTFFGSSNTSLTPTYANAVFIGKYDASGNLTWAISESSDSPVTSKSISANSTNVFIAGNFRCTFDSYSDHYGPANFNSSGYWDIFEGQYTNAGGWVMGRQLGGKKNQNCNGVVVDPTGYPHVAGSYESTIVTPVNPNFYGYWSFIGYNMTLNNDIPPTPSYCNDPYYGAYAVALSTGNSDIFIGDPFDPTRAPYDYYWRNGSGCTTPLLDVCVHQYNGMDYDCMGDTLDACTFAQLQAATQTSLYSPLNGVDPNYTYHWSNNQTSDFTTATSTGWYWVTITSEDGCYTSTDSIYVVIHPPPPLPNISDNVPINTNSTNPQQVVVCADSVMLTGGNYGNNSVNWQGPAFPPGGTNSNPVWVDSSGTYLFTVTDQYGCVNALSVVVELDSPLDTLFPAVYCMNDSDWNDSLRFCENATLFFLPYDSVTNPGAIPVCMDESIDTIYWTITPNATATILPYTNCVDFNYAISTGNVTQTGWYTITETIIRHNECGTDTLIASHSYYCDVLPAPPAVPLPLSITGDTIICPGDTAMLVVTGGPNYQWNDSLQTILSYNDTIYVTHSGHFTVSSQDTVTNSYGCTTINGGYADIHVYVKPQPVITMLPSNGVICPGDSVQLIVSGSGTFQWSGPSGPVGGNVNSIYVTSPGTYYCVVADSVNCSLLSNSVSIQQYNTPQIQAGPSQVICPGDTVTLTVVSSAATSITWQAPLSGNSTTQYVTQPGTYSVSVLACNIPTTVSITIYQTTVSAAITALSDTTVCEGDSVLLGSNPGQAQYLWSPGNISSQQLYVYSGGTYILTTSDTGGCSAQDSIHVQFVQNNLLPPIVSDTASCAGLPATIYASGVPTFLWYATPGGTLLGTGSPFVTPPIDTVTSFWVMTDDGTCRSQLSEIIVSPEECPSFTPNVFTPNGDGTNDGWAPYEPYAIEIHVWIYDRWGVLVYEWTDLDGYWDGTYIKTGKPCVDGTYYYVAHITEPTTQIKKETGFITLIRHGE